MCPGAIATVSGVAEATIQKAYQDIYPYPPNGSLFIWDFFLFFGFWNLKMEKTAKTGNDNKWRDKCPRNSWGRQEQCLSRYRQVVVPGPSAADVKWQPAVAVDTLPLA